MARQPKRFTNSALLTEIRTALATGEPVALLGLASVLMDIADPRSEYSDLGEESPQTRQELVEAFLYIERPESSVMLTAIAVLSGNEILRRRVQREVEQRGHVLPGWLIDLHDAGPDPRAAVLSHALGDADNVFVSARLPGDHAVTAAVYVDHNAGTAIRNAFVMSEAIDDVLAKSAEASGRDPDLTLTPLDPADARVRLTAGIAAYQALEKRTVTRTWTATRPLIEWVVGLLPAGGAGYENPGEDWDDDAVAALVEEARASRFFAEGEVEDPADLLTRLVHFGVQRGDPMRWSPALVNILMLQWIPTTVVAEVDHLAEVPDILHAFVRFCHHQRGVRPELTEQTQQAIDDVERAYFASLDGDTRTDPAAFEADTRREFAERMLTDLRDNVGGETALAELDIAPLPTEEFGWAVVPDDVHERVGEVLTLVEGFCADRKYADEYRTACRRLLADVAVNDPAVFRRGGRPANIAAAVCWLVGKNNGLFLERSFFGDDEPRMAVMDLYGHFGVTGGAVTQRSATFLRAVGVDPDTSRHQSLRSTRYLTGRRRTEIVDMRDRCLMML